MAAAENIENLNIVQSSSEQVSPPPSPSNSNTNINSPEVDRPGASRRSNVLEILLLWSLMFALFSVLFWLIPPLFYLATSSKPGPEAFILVTFFIYIIPAFLFLLPICIVFGLLIKRPLRFFNSHRWLLYIGLAITCLTLLRGVMMPLAQIVTGKVLIKKASSQLDPSYCDKGSMGIMKNSAEACRANIAVLKKDVSLCPDGVSYRNHCIIMLASYTKDISVCNLIDAKYNNERLMCSDKETLGADIEGFCNSLDSEELKKMCFEGWVR